MPNIPSSHIKEAEFPNEIPTSQMARRPEAMRPPVVHHTPARKNLPIKSDEILTSLTLKAAAEPARRVAMASFILLVLFRWIGIPIDLRSNKRGRALLGFRCFSLKTDACSLLMRCRRTVDFASTTHLSPFFTLFTRYWALTPLLNPK